MLCSVLEDIKLRYEIWKSVSTFIQYHIMWFNQSSIEGVYGHIYLCHVCLSLWKLSLTTLILASTIVNSLGLTGYRCTTDTKRTLVWHTNVKLRTVKFLLTTLIVWSNNA